LSSRLQFRPAEIQDADILAAILRAADRLEIQAVVGRDPTQTLREGIASSDPCWAVLNASGDLISIFGVVPDVGNPRSGMIWLLGSEELANNRVAVLRASRAWVDRIHQHYDSLWNYVDSRNQVHIDWLHWCGFHFVELVEQYGVEQRPFWRIERSCRN
jgi:hypothetical protein